MADERDLRRLRRLKEQRRNEFAAKYFRALYSGVDGMQLSKSDRDPAGAPDKSLTYGEIVHSSFLQILDFARKRAELPPGGTFVDLGCGTGKAVVAAALSTLAFRRVWGIELLEPLAARARLVADRIATDLAVEAAADAAPAPASRGKKPKPGVAAPSVQDVLEYVKELITASSASSLPCDAVVNSLCQKFGHKAYKAFLKSRGTFTKFVAQHESILKIENNAFHFIGSDDSPIPPAEEEEEEKATGGPEAAALDMAACRAALHPLPEEIVMQHGDIFDVDWYSEASVVYCASLLFSEPMIEALRDLCLRMPDGALFIGLRPLPPPPPGGGARMLLVSESFYRMSWHMAKVYIYEVRRDDSSS